MGLHGLKQGYFYLILFIYKSFKFMMTHKFVALRGGVGAVSSSVWANTIPIPFDMTLMCKSEVKKKKNS
jgi:hypothetical protein